MTTNKCLKMDDNLKAASPFTASVVSSQSESAVMIKK